MALETASTIADLVTTNPTSGDPKSQGDDHIRLIKTVLDADFATYSHGASGYLSLPDGIRVQWGTQNVPTGSSGTVYNFPVAFSAGCYAIIASHSGSSGGGVNVEASIVSTSQYRLTHNSASTAGVYFIAIGK